MAVFKSIKKLFFKDSGYRPTGSGKRYTITKKIDFLTLRTVSPSYIWKFSPRVAKYHPRSIRWQFKIQVYKFGFELTKYRL